MSQESRERDNTDLFDWEDQSEIPHEWGDTPEIPLDPEIDTHYWGYWQDADSADSNGPPESLPEQRMQEENRHADECRFRDMCSKLRFAETKIQELEAKLKKARDLAKEKDEKCTDLERKLQEVEKTNEGLEEKFAQVLLHQEQPDAKSENLQSKLQEMQGENNSLQQKLDLALGKKATILQEKKDLKMKHVEVKAKLEETEKRNKVVQSKLEDMMKQNKSLHVSLHQAHQNNAAVLQEMKAEHRAILQKMEQKHKNIQCKLHESEEKFAKVLKEKQELSISQRQLQDVLQTSQRSNGELRKKIKHLQQYKEEMEKICAEKMCAGIEVMMRKNAELEELHENARHKANQQEKMLSDMQEAQKLVEEKFKELKESHAEKHEIIEGLKLRCEKLEELNAVNVRDLHTIILQHKELKERCLKKKKGFKFFRRNSSAT